jgi:O-succinylbenzoic acid--CoA ligase
MARDVRLLEVAPGRAGVAAVLDALPSALSGSGPALALAPAGTDRPAAAARAAVTATDTVEDDVAVVLPTSGSTGAPRGVALPAAALLASAHAAHTRLGGPGAWLLALPVTSAGGLNVVVRALVAQTEPQVLDSIGGGGPFDPGAFAATTWRLDPSLPAYTSLVPAQAARLLAHDDGLAALRAYQAVLLGGARTPLPLLEDLVAAHVAAVTTYGMTETCGGAVYDGIPLDGVVVDVVSPDADGVGRVRIGGTTLARGYVAPPSGGGAGPHDGGFGDGWLLTSDLGRLHRGDDGGVELEVLGRIDDIVQVGGVNVALLAVEEVLAEVVDEVVVLAAPDETWGAALTAYVVGTDATDDELAEHVALALGRPAVPRRVVRLEAIPLLATGKPDRAALAEL